MQRDERAYLNDIVEACAAIERALSGLDLAALPRRQAGSFGR